MSGVKTVNPIYIDTHVAIWLAEKKLTKLSKPAIRVIEKTQIIYLPAMVELELYVLSESGKIKMMPDDIIQWLYKTLHFQAPTSSMVDVCDRAKSISWTRDVFDRMIVAEAMVAGASLVTKDASILQHYKQALW